MKWWLSRRVDEHFIFLSLSLLKKKSKKYFSLKYKYCLLSFCAQILYFVYIYILQLTIETNSPPRNLPFLLLMRSFPRSPPMRSTMAQSLTTLGDGTDRLPKRLHFTKGEMPRYPTKVGAPTRRF